MKGFSEEVARRYLQFRDDGEMGSKGKVFSEEGARRYLQFKDYDHLFGPFEGVL